MKTLIATIFLTLAVSVTAQTQYEQGMARALELWEQHNLDEAANLFERIATAEETEWLPDYYVALIQVVKCWNNWENRDEAVLKANLDKAQEYVNNINTKAPNEAYAKQIQAQVYTVWVAHDGMKYGMKYSGAVAKLYEEALASQPDNPIFIMNKAEWEMGAAKFFGTPIDKQCKAVARAIELFTTFKPASQFHPTFEIERAKEVQQSCAE